MSLCPTVAATRHNHVILIHRRDSVHILYCTVQLGSMYSNNKVAMLSTVHIQYMYSMYIYRICGEVDSNVSSCRINR